MDDTSTPTSPDTTVPCVTCEGAGKIPPLHTDCPDCEGSGRCPTTLANPNPNTAPDPLPRAIAAHWGEGTVRDVAAALVARFDHLTRFADEFGIDPDSHVGQQIATEQRRLACAKLDLNAVPLARTRLAAERVGARVCLTCEQVIATDLRSGLWRAARDVFAPGDSCVSHDHRHTPESTDG